MTSGWLDPAPRAAIAIGLSVLVLSTSGCGTKLPATQDSASPQPWTAVAKPSTGSPTPAPTPVTSNEPLWKHTAVTSAELRRASQTRVFFGHQSVGGNVMKGITALYKADGSEAPPFLDLTGSPTGPPDRAGYLAHAFIGRNGDPLGKIADFEAILRNGVGDRVEVAVMKLCYADVTGKTDVNTVFDRYRGVMEQLEHDFPKVRFLYATVPLKTNRPADNVARAGFNKLIRDMYGDTGRLYDIAAIESTAPDGTRVSGVEAGHAFDSLYTGYSTDGGHLNEVGTTTAAAPLLKLIATRAKG